VLVKVNFYGVYRDFLDRSGIELDLPEQTTIRELLCKLSEVLGRGFSERVLEEGGELHGHVSLSVNDRLVNPSEIDEPLNAGDEAQSEVTVLFVPPLMGGA
jgi:molybdopterin converting factor small subunit